MRKYTAKNFLEAACFAYYELISKGLPVLAFVRKNQTWFVYYN